MKRFLMIAAATVMVLGMGAGRAMAASNSLSAGSMGFSAGFDNNYTFVEDRNMGTNISARYFFSDTLAITATVGMETQGGDSDSDYASLGAGVRYYLGTDDLALFLGGGVTMVKYEVANAAGVTTKDVSAVDLAVGFGGEYFLHPKFSLEAQVGLGFGSVDDDVVGAADYTYFGTRTVGVSANFYF